MQTSEIFLTIVRRALFALLLIAVIALVQTDSRVRAENAGIVGIETVEVPALTNVLNGTSQILRDQGFAAHYLRYCPANWTGAISFEWAPNGVSSGFFVPLQTALVVTSDSQCHTLQLGGYYPNLRVRAVNQAVGTISAWYMASSAPIAYYSPTISSGGPSSPVSCDQNKSATIASGVTAFLAGPILTGVNTFYTRVCGMSISFAAAPGNGAVTLEWDIDNTCASTPNPNWAINTTASTPQVLPFPDLNLGSRPDNGLPQQFLCLANTSGQSLKVNYNYALISASSQ
jgi:hypothetical protein